MFVSGCLEVDGNISLGAEFVVAAKGPNDLDGLCKMMFYIKNKKKAITTINFFFSRITKIKPTCTEMIKYICSFQTSIPHRINVTRWKINLILMNKLIKIEP